MNVIGINLSMKLEHMLLLEECDIISVTCNHVLMYSTVHTLWIVVYCFYEWCVVSLCFYVIMNVVLKVFKSKTGNKKQKICNIEHHGHTDSGLNQRTLNSHIGFVTTLSHCHMVLCI
jgi:hypothetical protein